jgi:hypothetical protein
VPTLPRDQSSGKTSIETNFMFTKTHPLQSYHIDCIVGQKNQKEALLYCSAQPHVTTVRVTESNVGRKRERTGHITNISYHTYSSAEPSIMNVRSRLFVFFSMVSIVSGPRVHTSFVFSTRVCVMNSAAGGAEANAGRKNCRRVGPKINALVGKQKNGWVNAK